MSLLLDSHALLWWLADDPTLSNDARRAIAAGESIVFVSAATVWEISMKQASGKLQAPKELLREIDNQRFLALPISLTHAHGAGSLPRHHRDPFDRMLVAQAAAEDLTIVTRDARISLYGVPTLRA